MAAPKIGTNLGDVFPDFTANSTIGEIRFHDWLKDKKWVILFSHPDDFTPVCTTELATANDYSQKFKDIDVSMIGLSCNNVETHQLWVKDILSYSKESNMNFPIISDPNKELAVKFGMLDPEEQDSKGLPLTCRAVFVIGPDHKVKLSMLYPATTGRNFDEIYRVLESLQLTTNKKLATPANWKRGDDCIVHASVKDSDLDKHFSPREAVKTHKVPSGKGYMRYAPESAVVTDQTAKQ